MNLPIFNLQQNKDIATPDLKPKQLSGTSFFND